MNDDCGAGLDVSIRLPAATVLAIVVIVIHVVATGIAGGQ